LVSSSKIENCSRIQKKKRKILCLLYTTRTEHEYYVVYNKKPTFPVHTVCGPNRSEKVDIRRLSENKKSSPSLLRGGISPRRYIANVCEPIECKTNVRNIHCRTRRCTRRIRAFGRPHSTNPHKSPYFVNRAEHVRIY